MATDTASSAPAPISFAAALSMMEDTTLVRLPDEASERLPSRGQVAVHASIGRHDFERWLADEPVQAWPEPEVPDDLAAALSEAPATIRDAWEDITPMARWEWVRWVQATRNPQTRQRRVEVSISKLGGGKRRPCCFDLASCTDPNLAKSGKLPDLS